MADFAAYRLISASGPIKGDLHLLPATHDLAVEDDDRQNILREAIEAMDMRPADDIDFPLMHSKQRAALNAEDRASMLLRIKDARRVLAQIEDVDIDGSEIWIDDQQTLAVSLKTNAGLIAGNL
ncbi:MAG: hypothetical protein CVV45_15720 [Spirochaetae bacterium HGW-Spirochaetae-10]|nr:MAG: hypothetical protein CVV45_15720 [Spirochaetae bacterium HGW-Spirochaetae-10]